MQFPFFNKNTNHVTARWVVLLIDISLVLQTFFVAYLIRFNFELDFGTHHFILQLPLVGFLALVSFYIIGSYKGVVRHTGTRDAFNVSIASVLLAFFLGLIVFLNESSAFICSFSNESKDILYALFSKSLIFSCIIFSL